MTSKSKPSAFIYSCATSHRRLAPFARAFSYKLSYIFLDVDRIEETARRCALFSHNRWGVFGFRDASHGYRDGAPLRAWAQALFAGAGVSLDGGDIWVLTLPRVLGHEFNPLSLFIGYGPDGAPRGVIYEVNNTFKETHAYVAQLADSETATHHADKRFHVSPFLDVKGRYEFTMAPPGEQLSLTVKNFVDGLCVHVATLIGRRRAFSSASLLASALAAPFTTLGVLAAIHWQAFLIWIKGARYRPKPNAPERSATIAQPSSRFQHPIVLETSG